MMLRPKEVVCKWVDAFNDHDVDARIVIITGSPGTGKTTISAIVAKESSMEKSVHMHTDDFYHCIGYFRITLWDFHTYKRI